MSASSVLTFDLPRRPTLEDCGGATLVDDVEFPPDKTTMPYADQLNQLQFLAAAYGRLVPVCILSVRIISGTPTLYKVTGSGSGDYSSGVFTLTDTAAGNTAVTWPAGTFPEAVVEPVACVNYTTAANNPALAAFMAITEAITNGVRVRTYDAAGVLGDANFTLTIY